MFSVILPGQASGQPAEFACARCWKQKKKCDKLTPRCGRCTAQAATCVYSFQPPKQSVFVFGGSDSERGQHYPMPSEHGGSNFQGVSNTGRISPTNANSRLRTPRPLSSNSSPDSYSSRVSDILTTNGIDIEGICRRYFQTFHQWLPFMSEEEFWLHFFSSQPGTDPEFSALLLSIYLIASVPVQDDTEGEFGESVYSVAKGFWSRLQSTAQPSICLIQTGLLLATYENGQALEETSRSSMSACVRMGYLMELHMSVRRNVLFDSDAQVGLNTRRRLWWAIVILERLLVAKNLEGGCFFASQHPSLDDYLPPSSDTTCHETPDSKLVGVVTEVGSALSDITFADVPHYPALGQATYLLNRVSDHIRNCVSGAQTQEEAAFLDRTLQTFAVSLLRQADGQSLNGNYCTAFFTTIISLVSLHRYDLSRDNSSDESTSADSPSRPWLAIRALTRMFQEIARKRSNGNPTVPLIPPHEIYSVYLCLELHIEVGDRSDEGQWQDELQQMLGYLQGLQRKWKMAGVYLELIADMLGADRRQTTSLGIATKKFSSD